MEENHMQRIMKGMLSALLLSAMACGTANAQSYTLKFKSSVLAPADGRPGVPGAKIFKISLTIAALPPKGACTSAGIAVNSFSDGANSNTSLAAAGYTRYAPLSFETVCTNIKTGKITRKKTSLTETWVRSESSGEDSYAALVSLDQTTIGLTLAPETSYVSQAAKGHWRVIAGTP
jgi:hypothetical protein